MRIKPKLHVWIYSVASILLFVWIVGVALKIAGAIIHGILILALILLVAGAIGAFRLKARIHRR